VQSDNGNHMILHSPVLTIVVQRPKNCWFHTPAVT